ncbi:hypothetical protein [Streptomyces sp. NPDC046862]|uniref:hypothetical protein n=1 Tax=Streptomyces sp. NPDC046862 TaxID=3154603 RepID=UPI003455A51A
MPKPAQLSCQTCGTTELHHPLTKAQEAWLRKEIDARNVDGYWMCVKTRPDETPCRNLRRFLHEKRFKPPLRMPDEID